MTLASVLYTEKLKNMEFNKKIKIVIGLLLLTFAVACSYSFTGASVPPHLKSVAIPFSQDRSGSGEAELAQEFTDQLIRKFIDDNTLAVAEKTNSDALLECTITGLSDVPNVVGGGEDVTQRRITISAKVLYRDLVERKTVFDKTFSNFGDYSTNQGDLITERRNAINTAIDRITEDILLGVVSNW